MLGVLLFGLIIPQVDLIDFDVVIVRLVGVKFSKRKTWHVDLIEVNNCMILNISL